MSDVAKDSSIQNISLGGVMGLGVYVLETWRTVK